MADALSEDGLDIGAERSTRVVRERVTTHVGAGGLGYTEDVGPLLDLLPEVLWVKCGVTFASNISARIRQRDTKNYNVHSTVPELNLGTSTCESGESIAHTVTL